MIRVHKILCFSESMIKAQEHVESFFEKSMLIQYDLIKIVSKQSLNATNKKFWSEIDSAVSKNRSVLENYIKELKDTGCRSIDDCLKLEHGYPSKVFHLVAHFLDGFIGIDSSYYSLPEDSHWITESQRVKIKKNPDNHWLLHVEGHFDSESKASLIHT